MKVVDIIQCDPEVPIGVFGELLAEWRLPFRIVRLYVGDALPVGADAVIVLGGTMGVHDEALHPLLRPLKEFLARRLIAGTPLLGVCLGGQLLASLAGGVVSSNCRREQGLVEVSLSVSGLSDPLFSDIGQRFQAFQWHNDSFTIPSVALHLASSIACPGQAFRAGNAWGLQFHPEVDRDLVAAWSGKTATHTTLTAEFATVETTHRAMARQLLANFLTIANQHT